MKYLTSFLITLVAFNTVNAQTNRPKLVVGLVVDQMKYEYLQRFENKFSETGFKRLVQKGFESRNTHYNYVPTYTAPGHASIYTGTTPRYHGIAGNQWYNRSLGRKVYCVGDSLSSNIGGSKNAGSISPVNLIANTITDELKLATNFRSKVIGISIKDRSAVLPAGHLPDGAYWYDSRTGEFMTSDFYMNELPAWVKDFNQKKIVDQYSNQVWETLLPIEEYTESGPDNSPYEVGFKGKETPTFPYNLEELRTKNGPYSIITSTPFGNTLVLEMGKAAIEGEKLGQQNTTDFLALSLSSTDYIGHNFTPNSVEIEDTYLRLDQDLGQFLTYLDKKIGKENYLFFLTADHGVVDNPQFLQDNHLPGGYNFIDENSTVIGKQIIRQLGEGDWILNMSNDQVFLNRELIASSGYDLETVQLKVAAIISDQPYVSDVLISSDLDRYDYTDPLRKKQQNGYYKERSGDLFVRLKPGFLTSTGDTKGTSHGSGYTYDTHIPLLFYGKGIKPGSTVRKATITDIAPTLSLLLNISIPNAAVTGSPILEIFE